MPLRLIDQVIPPAAAAVSAVLASQQEPSQTVDPATAAALRTDVAQAIAAYRKRQEELRSLYGAIAQLRAAVEAARASGDTARLPALEKKLKGALEERAVQADKLASDLEFVRVRQESLVNALGTAAAWRHLTGDPAIAMLPVRIETRYVASGADHYELRVRIFPDTVHLDAHQPLMTAVENADGRAYWEARLKEGPEGEGTLVAWHVLCERHGEPRAFWIAAALDPSKRGGRLEPADGGSGAPPIPSLPVAPDGWLEPARMRALPDRWAIVGYRGEHRILLHWTKPVPPWLQATPELGEPGSELEDLADTRSLSAGIEWLTDFAAAEAVGMAARIQVPKIIARAMDRLMVFGISAARTRQDATTDLEKLLASHAATGLDFVAPGTATNNMELERTEYRSRNQNHEGSHQRLLHNIAGKPADGHAARLAAALGISGDVFRTAWHGTEQLEAPVEALHAALWPTTWGIVLARQVEVDVAPETLEFVRTRFTRHVRGLGLLPTLRLDTQPYGVLPVTSMELWQPGGAGVRGPIFVNLLRSIRNHFRRVWDLTVRMGNRLPYMPDSPDSQREMVAAMAMEPCSHIVRGRAILPIPSQVDAITAAMQGWWQAVLAILPSDTIDLREEYGGARLRTRHNAAELWGFTTNRPLVSAQEDKDAPLAANYLAALAGLPAAQAVSDHQVEGSGERSLLYMMLRSAYLELSGAAGDLADFAARLNVIQNLPVRTLELIANELVDVCSYRVDAWVSSLANERLPASGGVYLGGYGWSEGLEPPGEPMTADAAAPEDPDSAGFLHMPSTTQAKTAVVLYGGHLAHTGQGSAGTLSLDLASDRVRAARWLIDGQRQGQSLSALLGYRFERRLIENNLAQHIPAVRAALPLPVGDTPADGTDVAGANVVDGLALHGHWKAGTLANLLGAAVFSAVASHVRPLDDALDGLSDLLIAEGVHQAAGGNAARAAAAFDALADGETLQADPDVVATPAAGQQTAHRVMVALPGAAQPGWPGDAAQPRALGDRRLNGWAASVLGPPSRIWWRAGFFLPQKDEPVIREYTLDGLELSPLDLVYLSSEQAGDAPFIALLRLRLRQQGPDGQGGDFTEVSIYPRRDDTQPEGTLSLEEALGLAWAMKRLLAGSRALAPADLQLAAAEPAPGSLAAAELENRATAVRKRLAEIHGAYAASAALEDWWRVALLAGPVDPKMPDGPPALLAALDRRMAQADGVGETDPAQAALARLAALLGKEFLALPVVRAANGGALDAAFADQAALLEGDATRPPRWLHDYARVRSGCEMLDLLLTLVEAIGRPAPLAAGQLPVMPGQAWIGERLPAEGAAPRLSFVAHTPFAVSYTGELAGLLVDSWSEVSPSRRVTTGVAFNYDEPKAQAPQAILLAVQPDPARGWDFQSLEACLLETLELAKVRGLEAQGLSDSDYPGGDVEFYRPAIHLAGDERPELEAAAQGD